MDGVIVGVAVYSRRRRSRAQPFLYVSSAFSASVRLAPVKFALSFPFVFHTLGGFRHLVWDSTTKGIDNESANASSLAIFGVSAAASAALAAYTW